MILIRAENTSKATSCFRLSALEISCNTKTIVCCTYLESAIPSSRMCRTRSRKQLSSYEFACASYQSTYKPLLWSGDVLTCHIILLCRGCELSGCENICAWTTTPAARLPTMCSRSCSPSLMRTAAVVCVPEHYPSVDIIACQHMLLRDAQHLLRPWNDDAIAMDAETQAVTSSPAQLLQQTTHGTVSGLCFIEAVEGTGSTLPVRPSPLPLPLPLPHPHRRPPAMQQCIQGLAASQYITETLLACP